MKNVLAAKDRSTGARTIDELLTDARARLNRLTPNEALVAAGSGAVIVDTRSDAQRATEGYIPGALVVERNVLEWRFDPRSEARLPIATYELQVILICAQGYSSSLAAASLHDLGLTRATDVIGGTAAWHDAGLTLRNRPIEP
jgi:rhodanese-related sulfurtransferase